MRAFALTLVAFLVGCGGGEKEPKTPAHDLDEPLTGGAPASGPTTASATTASAPAEPAAPAKKRKPYEIVKLCPQVVTLLFGEDPKAPSTSSRSLGGNGRIDEGPRDNDGNQIIWLMVRGEALVKVRVSRATKRIEVGTSCDTLEMH